MQIWKQKVALNNIIRGVVTINIEEMYIQMSTLCSADQWSNLATSDSGQAVKAECSNIPLIVTTQKEKPNACLYVYTSLKFLFDYPSNSTVYNSL